MNAHRVIALVSMVSFAIALAYALTFGVLNISIPLELKWLAKTYVETSFDPVHRYLSAMTPEIVTAIVWDYRGIDTFFETAVFYGAIMGSIALLGLSTMKSIRSRGLSLIVKTVTRIVVILILVVGIAIALHGHLTPGGGFQGGATLAVSTAVALVTFGVGALILRGITFGKMITLRSLGLVGIAVVAMAVALVGIATGVNAYVFQNQPKPSAPIGMPYQLDGVVISGTVSLFNILESLAVAAGFTLLLMIFAAPEGEKDE